MESDKVKAARERLKNHKGGGNLKLIDTPERARAMQKKGVEARKRNKERLLSLQSFVHDLDKIGVDVSDHAPKGIDMLRFCMVQAYHNEDFELVAQYAEKIAQYETPKLASTQVTEITRDLTDLTDEEFEAELKKLEEEEDE